MATSDTLLRYDTGEVLYSFDSGRAQRSYIGSKAQAFTSDFTRFVFFNATTRSLNVINLIEVVGLEQLGRALTPAHQSVVTAPETLTWAPLAGVEQYDLYLGVGETSVAAATNSDSAYLGRVTGFTLSSLPALL